MANFKVISFNGLNTEFDVKLARGFRVLHNKPKCWREVCGVTTIHNSYESGCTTIYQSSGTKKYYMARYFDGCFSQMYAETEGIDWDALADTMRVLVKEPMECKELPHDKRREKRIERKRKAEKIILGMIG